MSTHYQHFKVGIIGAGTMGAGIAQVAAGYGHRVLVYDIENSAIDAAIARIRAALDRLVEKGRIEPARANELVARIHGCTALSGLAQCDLVIEAVAEDLEIKRRLFREVESHCSEQVILATNTSSISIDALARDLQRPHNFLGMHFFNPAPVMKLVEVVSGAVTGERTADCVYQLAQSWGKVAVHARNFPGFIVNRVARSFYAEPLRLLQEKAASVETIDRVFRESGGFRMGPFELMDLIGNDVNYAVTESVFNAFHKNPRFQPSVLQKEMVDAGALGRKSRRGWYDYNNNYSGSQAMKKPLTDSHFRPQSMVIQGDIGVASELAARASEAGISVTGQAGSGSIRIDGVNLMLTDGRTAKLLSEQLGSEIVLFDLAADFASTGQVALGFPVNCGQSARDTAMGFFNALGINVSIVADSPGLCLMRTVCMLANEAADAVYQGVCDVETVDTAMTYGVNYPVGPLQWADRIGLAHVQAVLDNIRTEFDEERYRCSPLIHSRVESGQNFY